MTLSMFRRLSNDPIWLSTSRLNEQHASVTTQSITHVGTLRVVPMETLTSHLDATSIEGGGGGGG
eukprot:CAMPEP_0119472156 /NCGR_PEP_ID=MMETSP1344-20130328/4335_1 /TAXON_ID=236787 /ORGANISM="Florenciella parvula, Strain CCMP2471" /LENGTH=64 /DNA_ID=CAMNT_0007505061 /DNA_START=309 /DNA_END=499 /DNA_ORIENTATION=-